mgnify:CR=1 FL=1
MVNSGKTGWKMVALVCAGLLVVGSAVVITWAVAGDGKDADEASRSSEVVAQEGKSPEVVAQEGKKNQPQSGDASEKEPPKEGGNQQTGTSGTNQNTGTQILPIQPSSVDEFLLNQAAMDYLMSSVGTTEGYHVDSIVISAIDSRWARVIIVQKQGDIQLAMLVYFYYEGGKWLPAPTGPGSPARPTDI